MGRSGRSIGGCRYFDVYYLPPPPTGYRRRRLGLGTQPPWSYGRLPAYARHGALAEGRTEKQELPLRGTEPDLRGRIPHTGYNGEHGRGIGVPSSYKKGWPPG